MKTINDIRTHQFTSSDRIFFDTNIWYFLEGPQTPTNRNDWRIPIYSKAYKKILEAKCVLHTDATVISEFTNSYAKLHYQLDLQANGAQKFKDYRNSEAFKAVSSDISNAAKTILRQAILLNSSTNKDKLIELLSVYGEGKYDFSDLLIIECCKSESVIFVTDDTDYAESGLNILTANNRLLKRS